MKLKKNKIHALTPYCHLNIVPFSAQTPLSQAGPKVIHNEPLTPFYRKSNLDTTVADRYGTTARHASADQTRPTRKVRRERCSFSP